MVTYFLLHTSQISSTVQWSLHCVANKNKFKGNKCDHKEKNPAFLNPENTACVIQRSFAPQKPTETCGGVCSSVRFLACHHGSTVIFRNNCYETIYSAVKEEKMLYLLLPLLSSSHVVLRSVQAHICQRHFFLKWTHNAHICQILWISKSNLKRHRQEKMM